MGELSPVGARGGVDLEIRTCEVSRGGGAYRGGMLTCLGEELRFFDWGDKIRDVVH